MSTHGFFFQYMVVVVCGGIMLFPALSHAFFPDDFKKMHEDSAQQREERREQFRQDVLERRKEVLTKWQDRKQGLEEKIKQERERITSRFESLRGQRNDIHASSSMATSTQEQEEPVKENIFSGIKKQITNIGNLLLRFGGLFEKDQ